MAAIICPNCQFSNPQGALSCQKCFEMLHDTVDVSRTATMGRRQSSVAVTPLERKQHRIAEAHKFLSSQSIAVYIEQVSSPIVLRLGTSLIIGRVITYDNQLRLDLAPYQAVEKGVSRQHVILKRAAIPAITLEDMGSSNGTWHNDVLLQPFRPATLVSGDELRLGKLTLSIYLP